MESILRINRWLVNFLNGIFINTNNTIYVANREKNEIVVWEENSIHPTKIIHGDFTDPRSLFVTSNGDIYIDDGGRIIECRNGYQRQTPLLL